MKHTLIILLLLPLFAAAQVEVSVTKRTKISHFYNADMVQTIGAADTAYVFTFQDGQYSAIRRSATRVFDRQGVQAFVDGLAELTKDQYKPTEATVDLGGGLTLSKERGMGGEYVAFHLAGGAWSWLQLRQCLRMRDEVYTALSIKKPAVETAGQQTQVETN